MKRGNTQPLIRANARRRGYDTGRAGCEHASPPYVISQTTENLIREWTAGYQLGLNEWRLQQQPAKGVTS
jgi:ribosome modulation factor